LFNKNKIERGVYQLPVPTEAELSAYAKELADKQTAPVAKAKAKVAKLAKAKTVKVKAPAKTAVVKEEKMELSRLQKIVDESVEFDDDTEDFNAILRENGITI
jgi:6-phosphogluconate dehydrogenase (decarboxylating)